MEGKCVLKPHFWFSFPKRAPSQDELWLWRNTTNNAFSVLTTMYWKLHSLFPSWFPLQQSGHCPWDLARASDITNSKGNVLTVPLIRQQRVIVIKETLRAKLWPLPQAHLLCLERWRAGGRTKCRHHQGLALQWECGNLEFGTWRQGELGLSQNSLTESVTCDQLIFFKASCT